MHLFLISNFFYNVGMYNVYTYNITVNRYYSIRSTIKLVITA